MRGESSVVTPADCRQVQRWIFVGSVVCASVCAVLLSSDLPSYRATPVPLAVLSAITLPLLVILKSAPRTIGWMIALLAVGTLTLNLCTPIPMAPAAMFALLVLSFMSPMQGIAAGMILCVAAAIWEIHWQSSPPQSAIMSASILGVLPCAAGLAAHALRRHRMMAAELQRKRRGEALAAQLHDSIAGSITDALLLLDSSADPDRGTLDAARGRLSMALARTHEVIETLDSGEEEPLPRGDALTELRNLIHQQAERLKEMGINGVCLLPSHLPDISTRTISILGGLLQESFNNIIKHADPAHGYVMTLEIAGEALRLSVSDVPRMAGPDSEVAPGMSSGLRRCESRLESLGGSLRMSAEDGRWSMEALLPLSAGDAKHSAGVLRWLQSVFSPANRQSTLF